MRDYSVMLAADILDQSIISLRSSLQFLDMQISISQFLRSAHGFALQIPLVIFTSYSLQLVPRDISCFLWLSYPVPVLPKQSVMIPKQTYCFLAKISTSSFTSIFNNLLCLHSSADLTFSSEYSDIVHCSFSSYKRRKKISVIEIKQFAHILLNAHYISSCHQYLL